MATFVLKAEFIFSTPDQRDLYKKLLKGQMKTQYIPKEVSGKAIFTCDVFGQRFKSMQTPDATIDGMPGVLMTAKFDSATPRGAENYLFGVENALRIERDIASANQSEGSAGAAFKMVKLTVEKPGFFSNKVLVTKTVS